ncbi:TPA: hypothetical protein RNX49_002269 [Pasteurella multocida]|nr:hypothetical protein [Pasteurella multocida]
MEIDTIIKKRIKAIKEIHASNRIEGIVDEEEHLAILERAKEPISNEEFVEKELVRFYAKYGVEYKP